MRIRNLVGMAVACGLAAVVAAAPVLAEDQGQDLLTQVAPVATDVNWALQANGGTVQADSNFGGYHPDVVNDGELNDQVETNRWADVAWASAETETDHWLEIDLAGQKTIGGVSIFWARDMGKWHASSNIVVQYWDGSKWVDVAKYASDRDTTNVYSTSFTFVPVKTDKVRIFQPKGGGPISRPNLMWVAEVQVWGAK